MSSSITPRAGEAGSLRSACISQALACLLCCAAPVVAAQERDEYRYLLFEPVPLVFAAAGDGMETDEPIDLQSWISSRQMSQAIDPAQLERDIQRYEAAIVALELAGGPYEPRLGQELLGLGALLQQAGDYVRAQQLFERASHINRVNYGLFNLEQIPIVEKTIDNHLARGDLFAADEQQEYLLYLQRKVLGDKSVDLLPALTRYAEWNVFAFSARLFSNPLVALEGENESYNSTPPATGADLESFRTRRLINAQNIYLSIIQILTNNYGISDRRLLDVERQLAMTNYFFATTYDLSSSFAPPSTVAYNSQLPYDMVNVGSNSLGYRQGREALERRIEYLEKTGEAAPLELARAKIDLGDWELIFKKRMGALEVYDEAYRELLGTEVPQEQIDALFLPPMPEEIPEFLPHRNTRAALEIPDNITLEYKGYIDVEFTVNRYGVPDSARILARSEGTTDYIEDRLARKLRRAQFRPRYDRGQVRESDPILARFYYTY